MDLAGRPQETLERAESLEQLRALYSGVPTHVTEVDEALPLGVDTEEDLLSVSGIVQRLILNNWGQRPHPGGVGSDPIR